MAKDDAESKRLAEEERNKEALAEAQRESDNEHTRQEAEKTAQEKAGVEAEKAHHDTQVDPGKEKS